VHELLSKHINRQWYCEIDVLVVHVRLRADVATPVSTNGMNVELTP